MEFDRWMKLCRAVGLDGRDEWVNLLTCYTEPTRTYHNAVHIGDCLEQLDQHFSLADDPLAVEFAIWFHDLVYDSRSTDNEARSAETAERFLKDSPICSKVGGLVMATRHSAEILSGDACLIVDIDLSILGRSEPDYDRYAAAIRSEYGWVLDGDYAKGRSRVLSGFLDRASIYSTQPFRDRYETQARLNLQRELD
ncbi:MAG: N-methyl-D-aspartate receptor NMDAR2C subunit, partial [Verrucomicrobiales bacterium VVV1]